MPTNKNYSVINDIEPGVLAETSAAVRLTDNRSSWRVQLLGACAIARGGALA